MSIANFNTHAIGRLGQDATVRQVGEKFAIAFSVAISEKRQNNENVTSWINFTYWSKSDKVAQYLTKGKLVSVVADWFEVREHEGKNYFNFRVKELNPFLEKAVSNDSHTAKPYNETPRTTEKEVFEEELDDLPF